MLDFTERRNADKYFLVSFFVYFLLFIDKEEL